MHLTKYGIFPREDAMVRLIRSAALTGYREVALAIGVDPYPLLAAAGFRPESLVDPDIRISGESYARLLEATANAAGADDIGLRLAEMRELSNLGPLGLLMRDQATFGDAATALRRYLPIQSEGLTLTIEPAGELAMMRIDVAADSPAVRQSTELSVGTTFRTFKALLGSWWNPVTVCFRHGPPRDLVRHRRFFACPIEFAQDFDGLVLRASDFDAPIRRADPAMARHVEKYLDTLLNRHDATTASQVRQLASVLLPSGLCTVDRVARQMGVDYRTVQRRLAREGESFSAILDDLRGDLATRYITAGDRSLTEISDILGFSALSAFSRWFRSRYGCSARDWQRNLG